MRRLALSTTVRAGWLAALGAVGAWWWRNRERRPYGPRWLQELLPRPALSRENLTRLLELREGDRVLEVGPGYGYYSLSVARRLAPTGELCLLDINQTTLDEVIGRACGAGLRNVTARAADAVALPFDDGVFSAAYLVAVLGELKDGARAVGELARVLEPGGRLVVGETFADPHRVPPAHLARWAQAAGLTFADRTGRVSYLARYRKPGGSP